MLQNARQRWETLALSRPSMHAFLQFVGPDQNLQIFGVRLLGLTALNGRKLLFTLCFFALLILLSLSLRWFARIIAAHRHQKTAFWTSQGISLITFVIGLLGFLSIWFDNPARLATGAGLVGAGLAFALQQVITSFAGYFVILRGKTFNVGDRIEMGGVRGDVVALNFFQTVIMEMGQPPKDENSGSDMWVAARQFTGRIVTIANSKIFEEPVYNYTRDFPYLWEELQLPISYKDDRHRAEEILLAAANKETVQIEELAPPALKLLEERFFVKVGDSKPRVYLRLTDNWIELTVRFLCKDHDIRGLKDRMSRDIIHRLDEAKIGIASSTYDIVGLPPIRVQMDDRTSFDAPPGQNHSAQSRSETAG
jgi:small-conductance mechanosensitive channel